MLNYSNSNRVSDSDSDNGNGNGTELELCEEIWWLEELRERYAAVHGYLGFAVCLFGVLSNLANIVVLTRRHMLSSTNLLLCALAVANATKMLSFIPVYAHFYLAHSEEVLFHTRSSVWVYYLLVQITLGIMLHAVALYITISIAIFRYLYIRYPIKGVQFCSIRNTFIVILVMTALSALISIPNIVCNDLGTIDVHRSTVGASASASASASVSASGGNSSNVSVHTHVHALTVFTISPSQSWPSVQVLNMWVQSIFIRFIPCIMLTLFTVLLLVEMHKAQLRRSALKGSNGASKALRKEKERDRTTAMLLAVVVLFLVVEFPQGVMAVANSVSECFYGKIYMAIGDLLDLVTLSNNAVNFIIYTTMSRQFRKSFVHVFWLGCSNRWSTSASRKASCNDTTYNYNATRMTRDLDMQSAVYEQQLLSDSRINGISNKSACDCDGDEANSVQM